MMEGMTLSERIAYYITLMRIAVEQDCTDPVGYANTVYSIAAIKPEWRHHWKVKYHD